jgi:peptidoglycan/LPS O-acetylase OafA/YrhL
MRATDGSSTTKPEIPALNGLRGLAALIVFVSHFSNQSGIWGKVLGDGGGQLGVMIFFALSGFLMSYLYLGRPWTRQTVVAYAVARAARVLPLYLVVVLAACCLNTLGVTHPRVYDVTASNLIEHLLFWKGASVLWTIPPEIWFYGIFAGIWFVQAASPRRFLLPLVLFALALAMNAAVVRLGLAGVFPPETAPEALVRGIEFFLVGSVGGFFFTGLARFNARHLRLVDGVFLCLLLALPLFLRGVKRAVFSDPTLTEGWDDTRVLLYVALLVWFSASSRFSQLVLGNKWVAFVGLISYSLYLLHLLVLWNLELHPTTVSLLQAFALTMVLSFLSFRLVEKPAQRMTRGLGRGLQALFEPGALAPTSDRSPGT